jgi:uncharacterized membrane protein
MAKQAKAQGNNAILYIFAYLLTWLSGILMYITVGQTDKRMKFHALQAILLGVVLFIIGWIPILGWIIELLGWLYGLYIGYMAYTGTDIEMPVIGDFAKQYSK